MGRPFASAMTRSSCDADMTLDGYMCKADYHALPEDGGVDVLDADRNVHVMWVWVTRRLTPNSHVGVSGDEETIEDIQ